MSENIIAIGIFVVFVLAELLISTKKQMKVYEAKDTIANLGLGSLTFLLKLSMKFIFFWVFAFFNQFALFSIDHYSWWGLLLLFLANDLMFYVFHRVSHESRLFWATHVVHHNSKLFNFTTSMRGNFLIVTYRFVFWIPLAIIGFDPLLIILMDSLAFLYQLWLHTELIKKLGPVEWVFNTPSHHRVHHASNTRYIDKNYGACLIIWDRLFGTFQEEEEKAEYGITKEIDRESFVNIAFHEFKDIVADVRKAKSWKLKWKLLVKGPGWQPTEDDLAGESEFTIEIEQLSGSSGGAEGEEGLIR